MSEEYRVKFCPTPVGTLQIGSALIPVPCKRWECPYCSRVRRIQLVKKVEKLFTGVETVKQITLTQRRFSKRNIMKDFKELRRVMKRSGIKVYSYFWTKEFTKNGQRHLHIIADLPEYVSQKWLSDVWRKITHQESFRVWINDSNIKNAAGYAMKYLTKAYLVEGRYNRKERRYGFCRAAKRPDIPYLPLWGNFWEVIMDPHQERKFELEVR